MLDGCKQKAKDIWDTIKMECNNDLTQMKAAMAIKIKELKAESCNRKTGLLIFFPMQLKSQKK